MQQLRFELQQAENTSNVDAWAEKLMRFCEVRRPVLGRKAREKWETSSKAALNMRRVTVFFLDYYLMTGDFRFLNSALKLGDMKWILDKGGLLKKTSQSRELNLDELLQMKICFVLTCEINRLRTCPEITFTIVQK